MFHMLSEKQTKSFRVKTCLTVNIQSIYCITEINIMYDNYTSIFLKKFDQLKHKIFVMVSRLSACI